MGAISATLMALAGQTGAHVVAQSQIFGQTFTFLHETLRALGVETTFVSAEDPEEVRRALRPSTKIVYIETPSNPTLRIVDISAMAEVARSHSIPLVVDGTLGLPGGQRPLEKGATLVVHSATKFLAGHSDVLCGAVAGNAALIEKIWQMQILLGSVLDPHAAWLLLRGIRTLVLRIKQQSANALALAQQLASHPQISNVSYPFLPESPGHRRNVLSLWMIGRAALYWSHQ